jgi:hypothetical protein
VRRNDIEDCKVWLANKPHSLGGTISPETHRQQLRTVRSFFERIIEWDWPGRCKTRSTPSLPKTGSRPTG